MRCLFVLILYISFFFPWLRNSKVRKWGVNSLKKVDFFSLTTPLSLVSSRFSIDNLPQQIRAKLPQNNSLNHTSIKFGTDILEGPLFHKRALATQKFKMAAFFSKMAAIHWPGGPARRKDPEARRRLAPLTKHNSS